MAAPEQVLLVALVIAAAIFDVNSRRIPNWLTTLGLAAGFVYNLALYRWMGAREAALGMGLALLIYVPLFALRAVGGGDVKLMAAIGSIAGPQTWLAIFLITAIAGGLIAITLVIAKGRLRRALRNIGIALREMIHLRAPYRAEEELDVTKTKAQRLPHGVTIAIGSLLYLAYGWTISCSSCSWGGSAVR